MRLDGQKIALTGAAGGMGTLLARRLRAEGAIVTGIDRLPSPECDDALVADLGDSEGLSALSDVLSKRRIDILINLAGLQAFGPFERQEPAALQALYAVNLVAPAVLTRAVLPQMMTRGRGQIVNIGSVMGAVSYPHFAAYSSAKAGLKTLSEALRREIGHDVVAITHIAPRAVKTAFNDGPVNQFLEMAKMKADDPEKVVERIADAIIRRRKDVTIGTAEQVFTRLNGAFPRLVDLGLAGPTKRARAFFPAIP